MINLEQAVTNAIKQEIDKEVVKAVEEAKSRLQHRIPEIVAGVCIAAMKYVNMRTLGDTLTIKMCSGDAKGGAL